MAYPSGPVLTPEQIAFLPHDTLGPSLTAIVWILTLLAAAFLSARVYCKSLFAGKLWWDDGILIAAFVCLLIDVCITTYVVSLGYGRHIWDFPLENFPKFTLPVAVRAVFSITSLAWSKTAFAVTLLRLTQGHMKTAVWFVIVTVNVSLGISALLYFVQCTPLAAAWDSTVDGKCIDNVILYRYNVFSGAYGAAMDFALAILPWKLLMSLQMRKKEKIGAALAMSMGFFAGGAAIVKTVNLDKLHNSSDMCECPSFVLFLCCLVGQVLSWSVRCGTDVLTCSIRRHRPVVYLGYCRGVGHHHCRVNPRTSRPHPRCPVYARQNRSLSNRHEQDRSQRPTRIEGVPHRPEQPQQV